MNVSVFGLGYVGSVTMACLASSGHRLLGVDMNHAKVQTLKGGASPIVEPGLPELIRQGAESGLIDATTDAARAIAETDVSIVCVGTPSLASGRINLQQVRTVVAEIAQAIQAKARPHRLVLRSTMLPGSTQLLVEEMLQPLLSAGLLTLYYYPEFLREGSAISDFKNPALSVVGTHQGEPVKDAELAGLFGGACSVLDWSTAEMIKYSCNYFHAIKVGFANEIGRLSKALGLNGSRVMEVLCQDHLLNISAHYLKPGNPFGGSCLPKDVSALGSLARMEGVSLPLLDHTLSSNQAHLDALIRLIAEQPGRRLGLLGLSFKSDTDDLRGSPMVAVAETFLGRGYQVRIYDPQLNLSLLTGANEAEINQRMPHLASLLMSDLAEVTETSDTLVVAQRCVSIPQLEALVKAEHHLVDVNHWPELQSLGCVYEGFCW